MQKWEYLRLYIESGYYAINGVRMKFNEEEGENTFSLMNKLGEEGWELVAQPYYDLSIFKRPIEE